MYKSTYKMYNITIKEEWFLFSRWIYYENI